MTPETLASFVVLGRVDNRPTDVCAAWIDSADRISSWVPREGQARVIHPPQPRTT